VQAFIEEQKRVIQSIRGELNSTSPVKLASMQTVRSQYLSSSTSSPPRRVQQASTPLRQSDADLFASRVVKRGDESIILPPPPTTPLSSRSSTSFPSSFSNRQDAVQIQQVIEDLTRDVDSLELQSSSQRQSEIESLQTKLENAYTQLTAFVQKVRSESAGIADARAALNAEKEQIEIQRVKLMQERAAFQQQQAHIQASMRREIEQQEKMYVFHSNV